MTRIRYCSCFVLALAVLCGCFAPLQAAEEPPVYSFIVEPSLDFDQVNDFRDGYAIVSKDGMQAVVDTEGHIVIPFGIYPNISINGDVGHSRGTYFVISDYDPEATDRPYEDTNFGLINTRGEVIVPMEHKLVAPHFLQMSDGMLCLEKDGKYGFVNEENQLVIPYEFDSSSRFVQGRALIKKGDNFVYIDKTGTVIADLGIEDMRNNIYEPDLPYIIGKKGDMQGMLDINGNIVIPFDYDRLLNLNEDRILARKDGEWCYLNAEGERVFTLSQQVYEQARLHLLYGLFEGGIAVLENEQGQWGAIDKAGKVVVPYGKYDVISIYNGETPLRVQKDGKWGLVDAQGRELIEPTYDSINQYAFGRTVAQLGEICHLLDEQGKLVSELDINLSEKAPYLSLRFSETLMAIYRDGLYGFVDRNGKEVIPVAYEDQLYYGGEYGWLKQDGKWGIFRNHLYREPLPQLEVVFEPEREYTDGEAALAVEHFHDGFAVVSKDGKQGVVDRYGYETIKPDTYDQVSVGQYSQGYYPACIDDKWGVITAFGSEVIPFEYDEIMAYFTEGLISVRKGDKWGCLNIFAEEVIPFQYDSSILFLPSGRALAVKEGKFGWIDRDNEVVVPFQFDDQFAVNVYQTDLQVFATMKDGLWGAVDASGKTIVPFHYDGIGSFSENLSWVLKDGKFGIVDSDGKVVLQPSFEAEGEHGTLRPQHFHGGLAILRYADGSYATVNRKGEIVHEIGEYMNIGWYQEDALLVAQQGEKWGYLSNDGSVAIPFKYDEASNFYEGFATVRRGDNWYLLNRQGEEMAALTMEEETSIFGMNLMHEGFLRFRLDGKYGFIDSEGEVVIEPEYDDATYFLNGHAWVKKDDRWGLLRISSKVHY